MISKEKELISALQMYGYSICSINKDGKDTNSMKVSIYKQPHVRSSKKIEIDSAHFNIRLKWVNCFGDTKYTAAFDVYEVEFFKK